MTLKGRRKGKASPTPLWLRARQMLPLRVAAGSGPRHSELSGTGPPLRLPAWGSGELSRPGFAFPDLGQQRLSSFQIFG